jgi:hypothetical protein
MIVELSQNYPHGFDILTTGAIVYLDLEPNRRLLTPLVPYKHPDTGSLIWTLNTHINTALSIDELLDAIIFGYQVLKIHSVVVFNQRRALFDEFVDQFFKLKKEASPSPENPLGNPPLRQIAKTILNACYGKLAQKLIAEMTAMYGSEEVEKMMQEGDSDFFQSLLDLQPIVKTSDLRNAQPKPVFNWNEEEVVQLVYQVMEQYAEDVDVWIVNQQDDTVKPSKPIHLALQVTAFSRMIMNRILYRMNSLFDPDDAIGYTDTDSLVVHIATVHKLQKNFPNCVGEEIGQLDDELHGGLVFDAVFLSPKFYAMAYMMPDGSMWQKIKTKGFPHKRDPIPWSSKPTPLNPQEIGNLHDLPLDEQRYRIQYADGRKEYHRYLHIELYHGFERGEIASIKVYFNTMQRRFFNRCEGNHLSGIQHQSMKRSIQELCWWKPSDHGMPARFFLDHSSVSVPCGYDYDASLLL